MLRDELFRSGTEGREPAGMAAHRETALQQVLRSDGGNAAQRLRMLGRAIEKRGLELASLQLVRHGRSLLRRAREMEGLAAMPAGWRS